MSNTHDPACDKLLHPHPLSTCEQSHDRWQSGQQQLCEASQSNDWLQCRAPASTSPIELLSLEVLSDRIEAWLTEAADAGDATLLARELATGVQPEAVHEFEKAVAAVFLAGAEVIRPASHRSAAWHSIAGAPSATSSLP